MLADLPPIKGIELRAARPTTQILDRSRKLLYEVVDPDAGKQIDLTLTNVPRACVQATIATEDARFFVHFGVDPLAIADFFATLHEEHGDLPGVVSWISTHPQHEARIAAVKDQVAELPRKEYRPLEIDLDEIKERLQER